MDSPLVLAAKRVFTLDLRSIALFRILLASLLLVDLCLRSSHLVVFYSDDGVLPRHQWLKITHQWHWSIHAASGEWWWQALLFLLAAAFALALLIGYRTRLAAVASFVLLASLLNRNGLLLQGGDVLLMVMSFWAMFLPLGGRYSIDEALQAEHARNPNALPPNATREQGYFSVATIAIVFQVLYLYFFTAILKSGDAWTSRFDAAFYAVSLQHFATPLGQWISQFPTLLKLATIYVLAVEFIAPLLVLCPFWWPRVRIVGLLLLASLHTAFVLMLHIGLFPLIDFMALSLLIPGALWSAWRQRPAVRARHHRQSALTIYYDEDCGFCLKTCLILRTFLLPRNCRILRAQNYPAIHTIMEAENSWVVTDQQGSPHVHWHAMVLLFKQRWPFRPLAWLMSLPPLLAVGNRVYRWVAVNRGLMGDITTWLLPYRTRRLQPTVTGSLLAALFFYIVTAYNVYDLPALRGQTPQHVNYLARIARLDQRWDMFAPYPLTSSSYLLVPAKLRNGETVNLYPRTSNDSDWQPPSRFYPLYDGYRWRKYLGRLDSHRNNAVREAFGSYQCRQWNRRARARETQLATLEMIVVKLHTNTEGQPKRESRRRIWRHWCFPEFADS